jgi:hypothetical protein
MKTINLGLAALMLSLVPAYADDNVLCVQQQVAARGYDPGPLDGMLGSRTLTAAQSAAAAARLTLPALSTATAGAWCQALQSTGATSVTPRPAPQATFPRPSLCPRYVIDPDDPCFWK